MEFSGKNTFQILKVNCSNKFDSFIFKLELFEGVSIFAPEKIIGGVAQ